MASEALSIIFDYIDAVGNVTSRHLKSALRFAKGNSEYIQGFCVDKQESRTFRVDRILGEIRNAETGNTITSNSLPTGEPKDFPEDQYSNRRSSINKPFTAPSGYTFPFFPHTDKTLVRINDLTDYREMVNIYGDEKFSQQTFDHAFDSADCIELEVEPFSTMFKTSTLKKLGIKQPPSGWPAFHEDVQWRIENGEPLVWAKKKQIHKHLHLLGLLVEIPPTRELIENYLHEYTATELKEICRKNGLKVTGAKGVLVNNLIDNEKVKIPTFLTLSEKYRPMVKRLEQAYRHDLDKQMKDKPSIYREALDYLMVDYELLDATLD